MAFYESSPWYTPAPFPPFLPLTPYICTTVACPSGTTHIDSLRNEIPALTGGSFSFVHLAGQGGARHAGNRNSSSPHLGSGKCSIGTPHSPPTATSAHTGPTPASDRWHIPVGSSPSLRVNLLIRSLLFRTVRRGGQGRRQRYQGHC